MRPRRVLIALSMIVLGSAVAQNVRAEERAPSDENLPFTRKPPRLDHRRQTGVSLMPGLGYRVIVPYAEKIDCGDKSGIASKRVCTNKVPFFLDLQLSYGATARLDLIMDVRFGVEGDPVTGNRQFALAPGLRFWLDQDVNLKFYTTVQGLYDSTAQDSERIADDDFGIRNANGLMYDVIKNVGFFFQFGESVGLRRWFRIELDAGIGVQIRFP